jgi:Transposase DDE domain group 1
VKNTACRPKIIASADGSGIVSQAGALLLTQVLQVTGLERQLSAGLERWRAPRAVHDPGKIVARSWRSRCASADSTQRRTHLRADRT